MGFADRREAGRLLAATLAELHRPAADAPPVVLAIPRGGVPVGVEVARGLHAPLDVIVVRKLGAPGDPELAIGAIAEDGTSVLDAHAVRNLRVTQEELDDTVAREDGELRRRVARYRSGCPPVDLRRRTAIVVDDGLATGLTELAAVRAVRARDAAHIVVAAPVASRDAIALLSGEADDVVVVRIPAELWGVGCWYDDFAQVSDADVVALLAGAAEGAPPG